MSPARSKAQFKKMFLLHKAGQISDSTLKEYTDNVNYDKLPNKIKPKRTTMKPTSRLTKNAKHIKRYKRKVFRRV